MKIFNRVVVALIAVFFLVTAISMLFPEKIYNISIDLLRSRAGLVKKEIKTGDHNMVYLEGGTGDKTIVLLHGFGGDKDNWPDLVRAMPGYRYIIPDLPGFGESEKIESAKYDVKSQVGRLDRFFTQLGLNSFYLAGNSMGGNIAGIYSAVYPSKVKALILLNNSGVVSPVKSELTLSLEKGINPLLVNSREDFDRLLGFIFKDVPYIPYPVKGFLADRAVAARSFNDKIFKDLMSAPAMLDGYFKSITMPVLIIWGDSDRLLDVSAVSVLESGIKNHTTRILKDCGHIPMMERPEETGGYITQFIDSVK